MAPIYMILLKFLKKLHEIEKNGFEALEGPSRSVSNLMACFLCSHFFQVASSNWRRAIAYVNGNHTPDEIRTITEKSHRDNDLTAGR